MAKPINHQNLFRFMKQKIYVTRNLPKPAVDKLKKFFDVKINTEDKVLTKKELVKNVKGKNALLCLLSDKIDSNVIKSNPELKVISNCAVGFDNIDIKTANNYKIPVCNTPGILTETTALSPSLTSSPLNLVSSAFIFLA